MSLEKLDLLFPYLLLTYGATMTFVLNIPFFAELSETRFPAVLTQQLKAHRVLAFFCMLGGAAWALQNIWL